MGTDKAKAHHISTNFFKEDEDEASFWKYIFLLRWPSDDLQHGLQR